MSDLDTVIGALTWAGQYHQANYQMTGARHCIKHPEPSRIYNKIDAALEGARAIRDGAADSTTPRALQEIIDALEDATAFAERESEMFAARNCESSVIYSPLATVCGSALGIARRMLRDLERESE